MILEILQRKEIKIYAPSVCFFRST
jgi:hypothetical protein